MDQLIKRGQRPLESSTYCKGSIRSFYLVCDQQLSKSPVMMSNEVVLSDRLSLASSASHIMFPILLYSFPTWAISSWISPTCTRFGGLRNALKPFSHFPEFILHVWAPPWFVDLEFCPVFLLHVGWHVVQSALAGPSTVGHYWRCLFSCCRSAAWLG